MNSPFLVGCHDCDFHRRVEDLNTALDWFERHKTHQNEDHTVEVWSKQYLEEMDGDAPDIATSDVDENAPSPQPTARKDDETDRAETDD
ncbi:hypothetical protein ACFPYI_04165 [Halomarina salina]|uniref:Uncharacterized protein n=1 Tax=Halomarina salina TaxID=1872699 RepID=A0ABD5RIX3_9EURY|nr:hypothetical protein [Halomarina salina]